MTNRIQTIALDKLIAHPDNPNRMSKDKFAKLLRNIKRTGHYEPLIVRPCPKKNCNSCENRNPDSDRIKCFQIINGHHRWQALKKLGYKNADAVVWDIDDRQTDIMLATLNRLVGSDVLDKKMALLKRLNHSAFSGRTAELAKLLPHTASQIKRLTKFNISDCRKALENHESQALNPLVFFLNDKQQAVFDKAMLAAMSKIEENSSKAIKNSAALTYIAQNFINSLSLQVNKQACFVKENNEFNVDN